MIHPLLSFASPSIPWPIGELGQLGLELLLWFGFNRVLVHLIRRAAALARSRAAAPGDQNRVDTLERMGVSVARVGLGIPMGLSVMDTLGINVKALMAGVGVAGLGISLAAQSIIRDFLSGFLILMENQFNVGEVVVIDGLAGTVEAFSLRCTRLRSLNGELIIIPNSQISRVVNHTRGWSVANVEVNIPYEEDPKGAMAAMEDCAAALMGEMGDVVIEPPVIQGIVDFKDSWMVLRALIKTVPGSQWEVGRRYRMLLKEAFDSRGIQFAYPHLDVSLLDPQRGKSPIP